MESREYTAEELREQADYEESLGQHPTTWAMLRQAAEMRERCEERHANPYGISDDDYNYILKGSTNG